MDIKSERLGAQKELNAIEAALRGDVVKAKELLPRAKALFAKYGFIITAIAGFLVGRFV